MISTYLAEIRADIEEYLSDTCSILTLEGAATSDGQGGILPSANSRVKGYVVRESDVPCRIQSTRMKISLGEAVVGGRPQSSDEGILVLPYDKVISNADIIEITSGENDGLVYEITQQMSQTEAFTRVFSVLRKK